MSGLRLPIGAAARAESPEMRERRFARLRLALAALLAGGSLAFRWAFARVGKAAFPWYRNASKALIGALATLVSVAPVALWDIALALLLAGTVVSLVRRVRQGRPLLPPVATLCLVASVLLALFVDGWALNHYAPPLADELDLEVRTYSPDELSAATEYYLCEAAEKAPQVPRTSEGALERQDFYELARIAGASYERLGTFWEVFRGTTVPVKALLVWGEPLLWSGHTGIFWAPTGEAGVPLNSAIADEPFVMCHEAAHRLGLASEQEANFAAFLACTESDDARFVYAGSYNAFSYCFNALYRIDPDRAVELLQEVADSGLGEEVALVWSDRIATHEHYAAYDGPFEKVGTTVNDGYLKSFGEQAGVQSYGLVVDYLIAWQQMAMG